jgi:Ser/Thr protein kinase RdoA (MazF antagonist)
LALSDTNTIRNLLIHHYGIPEPRIVRTIDNGNWNRIYEMRGDGHWILRISHHRKTEAQLAFELHAMQTAGQRLSIVPDVRPTVTGSAYAVDRDRFYTLFQYMPGQLLQITDRTVELAGATLGRIHDALGKASPKLRLVNDLSILDFDWTDNYMVTGDMFDDAIAALVPPASSREAFDEIVANLAFLRRTRDTIGTWLDRCRQEDRLTEGITHGDYYWRNILMADGRITGVLDWDEAITSWIEYEVANATWEFARDDPRARMHDHRVHLFLDAYEQANPKVTLAPRTLRSFIALRRLIEIQLALFDLSQGETPDLDYGLLNVRYLKHLDIHDAK